MKRMQRLAAVVVCVLLLVGVVAFAQSEGEKTWDDAVALFQLAVEVQQGARYQDAIELYEEALIIMRALAERYAEGVILNNLGLCYKNLSNYQQAIDLYDQSLKIKRELDDRIGEARTLGNLGNCYYYLSDYKRAISLHEQALLVFEETDDKIGKAKCLGNLGNAYHAQAEYQRAIDYHTQSLTIFRYFDDKIGEVIALEGLGNCYRDLLDCAAAISYYEEALALHLELDNQDRAAEYQDRIADCHGIVLATQALAAFEQHRHQDAMGLLEDALDIARRLQLQSREWAALGLLGVGSFGLGDYGRAIDYFEQALEISMKLDDLAGQAADLNQLGVCYRVLSALDCARDKLSEALAIYCELDDRDGEAGSLTNLGLIFYDRTDYHLAIEYQEQALLIFREIDDLSGEAACLTNLGICYMALSDHQLAIDYHQQSLEIEQLIGNIVGEAVSLADLGDCYESMRSYDTALSYYLQSLALAVGNNASGPEFKARWGLGRTYKAIGQLGEALCHYELAIELVELTRDLVKDEELRQSYFGSRRTLYEEYLELLLELGRTEETLLVAERLRARTFLDSLYQSGLSPEQLQQNEAGINRTGDAGLPVMDYQALKLAVGEAQSSLLTNEAVLEYMTGDDGIYLWLVTSEETMGPQFIPYDREQLLRDVVALRRDIEPETKEVRGQLDIVFYDPSASLGSFYERLIQPALSQLDPEIDTLIIIPSGPLWYIPFSALVMTDRPDVEYETTSEAGRTLQQRQRYLIDEYTVAFLPSLASLPMLMEERAPSTAIYLALANPTLSKEQEKEVGSNYQFSVLETACIAFAKCIAKGEEDVHVKEEALEARAYNEAAGHEVLVYACHGIFNPRVPLDSRLLLAPSQGEEQERIGRRLADGDYYAYEVILTDHEGVDLVILAACETFLPTLRGVKGALGMTLGQESDEKLNMGQLELIVAGDEVVGLSRAFLSSGAQSVLGTLWQANPTAINELLVAMCNAYPEEGGSWAMALKEAQCAILQESKSVFTLTYQTGLDGAHPWFWGAYQLVGRWR